VQTKIKVLKKKIKKNKKIKKPSRTTNREGGEKG